MRDNDAFNAFCEATIEAHLWADCFVDDPETGELTAEPMDHAANLLTEKAARAIRSDCADFWVANVRMIRDRPEQAGHDFALTRNGHGAGFWDGDWPEHGDMLTEASKPFGTRSLWFNDAENRIEIME
jgi:hypothetical protein